GDPTIVVNGHEGSVPVVRGIGFRCPSHLDEVDLVARRVQGTARVVHGAGLRGIPAHDEYLRGAPHAPGLTLRSNDQVFSRRHLAVSEVAGTAAGRLMPLAL